jgi:hypothetical protein
VDRDEEVSVLAVGDARALVERDEGVVIAGEHHLEPQRLELRLQLLGDGQRHVLLPHAGRPDGAGVVSSVAGVDHHAPHLEAQLLRERELVGLLVLRQRRQP